ncbi:MAG: C39 family peptidase [Deltaproteobacteria bacterium]|nr:C39 family peptidase [Deltaproteobacteria bacterium]
MRVAITLIGVVLALSGCRLAYKGGATTVGPNALAGEWVRAAPTPVVLQRAQTDCGLAALAMVAGAWGRSWSVAELARHLKPTAKGVRLGALRDLARARGLEAYVVKGQFADLANELAKGRPVLLGLVLPFDQDNNLHHFEVAIAINPRDGTVVTLDPSTGDMLKRSRKVLDLEWRHAGYATLVVVADRENPRPGESYD